MASEDDLEPEDRKEAWTQLEIDEYGDRFVYDHTQFFMTGNHLDFFEELVIFLESQRIDFGISGSKLRLKFETNIGGQPAAEESKEPVGG